ncbi:MAG: PDZ domain-containing protein [Syntrophales bacterium]|nr:PDZ domain-containing protein [Syntrophales bacterium]
MCRTLNTLYIVIFLLLTCAPISQAQSSRTVDPGVLREIAMWKFVPEEDVVETFFSCDLVTQIDYCKRLNVKFEGFYKAYFPDGFVLTLSPSGEILEHYYNPSERNVDSLERNWIIHRNSDFAGTDEARRKRLITRLGDLNAFFEELLGMNDLYAGDYDRAVRISSWVSCTFEGSCIGISFEMRSDGFPVVSWVLRLSPAEKAGLKVGDKLVKVNGQSVSGWDSERLVRVLTGQKGASTTLTVERAYIKKPFDIVIPRGTTDEKDDFTVKLLADALAVRAFANQALGKREEFLKDVERSYSLDPTGKWAKRAMAFLHLERGNFNEALRVLPERKDVIDMIIEVVSYAKLGDMKRASDIYSNLLEDSFEAKGRFLERHLALAHDSLKPYAEGKLKIAKENESKGKYKEALKEYAEYFKFADEEEARAVRSHIAKLIEKYPQFFVLTEEARKFVIRAESYTSEGKFEKAVSEYKKALKIQPFFPALYKALALNYVQLKNYKQAIKNMKIYLELYPDAPDARAAQDEIYRWELLTEK